MLFTSFTALLALAGLSSAATTKRATVSTTLFAYGAGTNGAPVFYSDGKSPNYLDHTAAYSQTGLAYIG